MKGAVLFSFISTYKIAQPTYHRFFFACKRQYNKKNTTQKFVLAVLGEQLTNTHKQNHFILGSELMKKKCVCSNVKMFKIYFIGKYFRLFIFFVCFYVYFFVFWSKTFFSKLNTFLHPYVCSCCKRKMLPYY